MTDLKVPLSRRYEVMGDVFDHLAFREPTGQEYWAIGPISEWQPTGDATPALIRHHERVRDYALRLMVLPEVNPAPAIARLNALNISDTRKVEQAIKDFFSDAPELITTQTS